MAEEVVKEQSEKYDNYITTKDNPYDPKTQFDEWYTYDLMLGYNTLSRLARMIDYLTEELKLDSEKFVYEAALLEMVRLDPLKAYEIKRYPHEEEEVVQATEEEKEMVPQFTVRRLLLLVLLSVS